MMRIYLDKCDHCTYEEIFYQEILVFAQTLLRFNYLKLFALICIVVIFGLVSRNVL